MTKIVRETYQDGVLVAREIEVSRTGLMEIAKLCVHLVIAISVALMAALSYMDSQGYAGLDEQTDISDSSCRSPAVKS